MITRICPDDGACHHWAWTNAGIVDMIADYAISCATALDLIPRGM